MFRYTVCTRITQTLKSGKVTVGISKTKPRMRHLINVKEPHFFILRLKTMGVAVAKWCKFPVFVTNDAVLFPLTTNNADFDF